MKTLITLASITAWLFVCAGWNWLADNAGTIVGPLLLTAGFVALVRLALRLSK
jgi:hypothetical protein